MYFYNDLGYLDISLIERSCPEAAFFWIIGARRTGKTYGILDHFHANLNRYIFMRLTQEEMKYTISGKVDMYRENAFPWADDMSVGDGRPLYIYDKRIDEGKTPTAMALALSDVAKIRGYGAKNYDSIFLDEFIPETGAFVAKGIGEALKNAYMTINGNRELEGKPPVKMWCAANSNDLSSEILSSFNLTADFLRMQKRGQNFSYMPKRRTCLIMVDKSPISAKLANTAIFQCLGTNNTFANMALKNVFVNDDDTGVRSCPIKEFFPMCNIDDLTLYKHKSTGAWYVVQDGENTRTHYNSNNPTSYKSFLTAWRYQGNTDPVDGINIFYNTYTAKIKAYKLLKLE